jgi:Outer membrane protein beta-barrel domain
MCRLVLVTASLWIALLSPALAQDPGRVYAGGLFGISTLSADAQSVTTPATARVSLYKPENGPALNTFVGMHVTRYVSVQGNYVWNRNDLTLVSSLVAPDDHAFYTQRRTSAQHSVVADVLLYFRALDSAVRPYLSTGVGFVHFASDPALPSIANGIALPVARTTSTRVALRVAVGIDLSMAGGWSFRYSFSETITGNPVSVRLTPPGERNLANFQNLFGLMLRL